MQHSAPSGTGRFHEHRDETRRWVDQPPQGHVTVKDRHHVQPVHSIRDVSVRGVSLALHDALMPGEPVVIQLSRGNEQMEFYAYVCWCRSQEGNDTDWQTVDGEAAGDKGNNGDRSFAQHVAGLRVYGPQSLANLIDPALRNPAKVVGRAS